MSALSEFAAFPIQQERDNLPDAGITDPSKDADPIYTVLLEIRELNNRKRADYASNSDIFSNFKEAALFGGLRSAGQSVEALLGTKTARLRQLLWLRPKEVKPKNESIRDTLIDRAVYGVIAVAMYDQGLYEEDGK